MKLLTSLFSNISTRLQVAGESVIVSLESTYNTFDIKKRSRHQGNLSIKRQEGRLALQGSAHALHNHSFRT
jgi:hypothetical protein